jgi:excisionase family DNA binding protein
MESPWMTIQEACEYTKCKRGTILGLIRNEQLPAYKIGNRWRIHKEQLDRQMLKGWPKLQPKPALARRRHGGPITRLV